MSRSLFRAVTRLAAALAMCVSVPGAWGATLPRIDLRADINTGANSSPSGGIGPNARAIAFEGGYVFAQRTVEHGHELWSTDGTVAGTRRRVDLCPGGCDGLALEPSLHVENGMLYFAGSDGRHGFELWRLAPGSDTPVMVADLQPGAGSSSPGEFSRISFSAGGTLVTRTFFTATRADVGRELWRLQGDTVALEIDTLPGLASSSPARIQLCSTSQVCFEAVGSSGARELRLLDYSSSSAPPTGTSGVGGLGLGNGRSVTSTTPLGPRTYLLVRDTVQNTYQLHVFGNDAGATTLLDSGSGSDGLRDLVINAALFRLFYVRNGQLMLTDGTLAGTMALPAAAVRAPVSLGNRLLFTATSTASGRELYASDGSIAGTGLLRELMPGAAGFAEGVQMLRSGNGARVFLAGTDTSTQRGRLFVTDATAAGTIEIGSALPQTGHVRLLASGGSTLMFTQAPSEFSDGEPWFSAGTVATTVQLGAFRRVVGDSHALVLGGFGTRGFGFAFDGTRHRDFELDATTDVAPQMEGEVLEPIGERLGRFWYIDRDVSVAVGDGHAETAVRLGVRPLSVLVDCYVERGGFVYFLVTTDGNSLGDVEIARSDGTVAGTSIVTDLSSPGQRRIDAFCTQGRRQLVALGERLLFVGISPAHGTELFALSPDDSPALLRDIRVGADSSLPRELIALRGRPGRADVIVFTADDGVVGVEPWASDGTGQGTVRLADLNPGFAASSPQDMTAAGDRVFFTATSVGHGRELYVSDGTAAGTHRVADLFAGPGSAFGDTSQHGLLGFGQGRLWFTALGSEDPDCALYQSDGTAAGTQCAYDTASITLRSIGREALLLDSGALVFAADRGATVDDGRELRLMLDGMVLDIEGADLMPGAGSSNPSTFRAVGGRVLFSALGEGVGQELFRLETGDLKQLFSNGFER